MEDPRPQLQAALKEAMKARDNQRRDMIRYMQSLIKQVEIDERKELSAVDVVELFQKEAKRRRESVEEARANDRADLAEEGEAEIAIIESFLPQQMSADDLRTIVKEVIAEVGAETPKDMGKVMGPVMQRVRGQADGKLVNQIVREELAT